MLTDCEKCMRVNPKAARQSMGCGYEPEIAAPVLAWDHGKRKPISVDDHPRFCAGYTTKLPEVIEVLRARAHWEKGELAAYAQGPVHEHVVIGIELVAASSSELQRVRMEKE